MTAGSRPPAARRYGQNHLVDRGTLDAVVALTDAGEADVVLEVGAADGVFTRPLLDRAALVHAFEIDGRFLPALERLGAERPSLKVHAGDALKADLGALSPPPTLLAANLAYNIAIPVIMKSLHDLPSLRRWAVMVQRELGERLFAAPSTKAYAAVSVIVQLACRRVAVRRVPRTVFSPRPRVDSLFVVFERRDRWGTAAADEEWSAREAPGDAESRREQAEVERLVRVAFGQRRKMLANSLAGAPSPRPRGAADTTSHDSTGVTERAASESPAGATGRRSPRGGTSAANHDVAAARTLTPAAVRAALRSVGTPENARPEELPPARFVELARALADAAAGGDAR